MGDLLSIEGDERDSPPRDFAKEWFKSLAGSFILGAYLA